MKEIEKLIVVLCILFVVTLLLQYGGNWITKLLMDGFGMDGMRAVQTGMIIRTLARLLVPIGIAAWMFGLARRDQNRPWVWALLGLLFQFLAPILYFVIKLHQQQPRAAQESAS